MRTRHIILLGIGAASLIAYAFEGTWATRRAALAHQDEVIQRVLDDSKATDDALVGYNGLIVYREAHFKHGSASYWAQPPGHLEFADWRKLHPIPSIPYVHDSATVASAWELGGVAASLLYVLLFVRLTSADRRNGTKTLNRSGIDWTKAGTCLVAGALIVGIGVPSLRRANARENLDEIEDNLRRIDAAAVQAWMETSMAEGAEFPRSSLDGSSGSAYIEWPTGPVPGEYEVTVIGAKATFNGGSKGALTANQWEKTCRNDPTSCGL